MPAIRLAYVNYLARDIEALSNFYAELLGLRELETHRSPIYRCLDAGGLELGFNAAPAYDLLGIGDRRPGAEPAPVTCYATFEASSREGVDAIAARAAALGGGVRKPPYLTYYNGWQAVLADPEGNVFRVNHRLGARRPAAELESPPWAPATDPA